MAKGRSLTISRSERFLGTYNQWQNHGSTVDTDLQEDDVWSMANDDDYSPNYSYESTGNSRNITRRTPRDDVFDDPENSIPGGRISHQFHKQDSQHNGSRSRHVASSLPVNVPDWNKIYRINSTESLPDSESGGDSDKTYTDLPDVMVPPHEYLANRRNSAANSVFVGVGRTLKGRDMSRVRDAVWSQTGFYG